MELTLERILRLDRSKRILILVGTLLLLVGVYVWLFFLPMRTNLGQLDTRLSKLLSQKAEQEAIVQNLPAFRAECRNLENQLNAAMAQLPNKKEIPTLLQNISNLGRESSLDVPYFKPGNEIKKDFYAEVPVDIKLSGPYHAMLKFFYQVGNLPRIVNIADLSVEIKSKGDSPDELEAACRAVTYKFLEESEREPADQTGGKRGKSKKK